MCLCGLFEDMCKSLGAFALRVCMRVAVCCSVLQGVTVCHSVLQFVLRVCMCGAVYCSVLQCVAVIGMHEVSMHTIPKCIMSYPIYWGADAQYFQIPANKPYISAKKPSPEMHNFIKMHHVKSYMLWGGGPL